MFLRPSRLHLIVLVLLASCGTDDGVAVTDPAPGFQSHRLERVDAVGSSGQPVDGWMGSPIIELIRVRVVDSSGLPVQGARVRFSVAADGGRLVREGVAASDTAMFALSDQSGIVTTAGWILPSRDTVNTRHILVARTDVDAVGISYHARAWRDLTRFGGTAPAMLDMPVDRQRLSAILPLGVLGRDEALPSSDALLVPKSGPMLPVRAMADGIITEMEESSGAITMRVRDHVLVRLGGMTLRPGLWVGRVMHAGDTVGALDATRAGSMLAVRVLDGTVQRTRWVNAERYGARQNTAFFAQYLPEGARSAAYALVRRAAPDLEGRIDYDRDGRLVGTWFDPGSPAISSAGTQLTTLSPFAPRRPSELDPSASLGPVALTFAYDAERPGQIRIVAGSALATRLGLRGVRAVAWEDIDPAEVGTQSGIVRYHLFTNDAERIGEAEQVLLVQLLDATTLRAELVPAHGAGSAGFSSRASILIR